MTTMLEYALRTVLAFVVILFVSRALGRKEPATLTLFDFAGTVALSLLAIAALVMQIVDLTLGVTALAVWIFCFLTAKALPGMGQPAPKYLANEPVMVIHNGRILEAGLAKTSYKINRLLEQLRWQGISDLSTIQIGILQTDGELSLITKPELPLTPAGSVTGNELIIDGQIIETALRRSGFTREWLQYELNKRAIDTLADVILATITPSGRLYIDVRENNSGKNS